MIYDLHFIIYVEIAQGETIPLIYMTKLNKLVISHLLVPPAKSVSTNESLVLFCPEICVNQYQGGKLSLTHSLTHSQIGPVGLWPLKVSDLQNIIHVPQHLTQWDTNGCGWGVKKRYI